MDTEKKLQVISRSLNNKQRLLDDEDEEKQDIPLPGFRFHPTDQELVGFYLRRKVDKKPLNIEIIKQIDIYKYDPWDLPRRSDVGDKEWYFYCRRGRKYRNSIRPNRVTGSGFWKATGIDRPIYYAAGSVCIGLKKSLVYYRGSAGKGTKTEWMMHEFRLPPSSGTHNNTKTIKHMDDKSLSQEAEVWTLCRIIKRSVCHRKTLTDWRGVCAKRNPEVDMSSKTCSGDSGHDLQSYISFQAPIIQLNGYDHEKNPFSHQYQHQNQYLTNGLSHLTRFTSISAASDQAAASCSSSFSDLDIRGDWDDLRSVVEFAAADRPVFFM